MLNQKETLYKERPYFTDFIEKKDDFYLVKDNLGTPIYYNSSLSDF
jgi:hypothetical protein